MAASGRKLGWFGDFFSLHIFCTVGFFKPFVCITLFNQYAWASFVAQLVKNLPAKQETWVQPLGWEDPLQEGMATHSIILG